MEAAIRFDGRARLRSRCVCHVSPSAAAGRLADRLPTGSRRPDEARPGARTRVGHAGKVAARTACCPPSRCARRAARSVTLLSGVMADRLDSQAAAFAQLLKLSGDPDAAFRTAVALADGLFPHQIEGVAFLLGRRRAILADDMGLGKTRQAIVSLRHLTPGGPRLVVCPASVKRNWAREIAVVAADASVSVIEGTAPASLTAEWTVINYDILGRHIDTLLRVPWAALVFDEAHYLKNHTSARS